MNALVHPDRISILRNVSAIRANWTPQERQTRANVAKKYSRMLLRMITEPAECDEVWAVGAPTDIDLGRLALVE